MSSVLESVPTVGVVFWRVFLQWVLCFGECSYSGCCVLESVLTVSEFCIRECCHSEWCVL